MRRALELEWPALLVGSACAGLVLAVWVSLDAMAACALVVVALVAVGALDGPARVAALGVALAAVGLWWGSLRMDALERSVLSSEVGESGSAEIVTTAAGSQDVVVDTGPRNHAGVSWRLRSRARPR